VGNVEQCRAVCPKSAKSVRLQRYEKTARLRTRQNPTTSRWAAKRSYGNGGPMFWARDPYYNSNFSRERADFSLGE